MENIFNKTDRFSKKEDNLAIFLFHIIINKEQRSFNFEQEYNQFKITQDTLERYNNWIDSKKDFKFIISWISDNNEIIADFYDQFTIKYQPKVVIWSDRKKNDYYLEMLQKSHEFECYLETFFKNTYNLDLGIYDDQDGQYNKGECELGIEIKFDMKFEQTGNLYIEYAEKSDSENEKYISSGILKNDDSKYFLIGNRNNFYIFPKKNLYNLYKEQLDIVNNNIKNRERKVKFIKKDTSLGFIISIDRINKYVISIDELIKKLRNLKTL